MSAQPEDLTALLDPDAARKAAAAKVKQLKRVNLPPLKYWNYGACRAHQDVGPQVDCEHQKCGGDFFDHQTVTIAWAYMAKKAMIASVPGAGKTNMTLGLAAMLKERGELTQRCVIIVQTPAVLQWLSEAQRFVPQLHTEAVYSGLTRPQRVARYVSNWDILIVGYHMLMRDVKMLEKLDIGMVVTDDVDPLLDHENLTHKVIVKLAEKADRVLVMNASNLQTRLQQIHAAMVPMDGRQIWGPLGSFERRYIRQESITEYTASGRRSQRVKTTGFKNMTEFKQLLQPHVIRHGYDDLTDVRMPDIMPPENVWLELHPRQREKYDELRQGVLRVETEQGEKVKHATALTMVGYGQQICAGLPALGEPDGEGASVKLDWLMDRLDGGAWADTKVVTFIKNTGLVEAFQHRLDAVGIGHSTVWGRESNPMVRREAQQRFWSDPNCRVFMGTSAIERSLNLQAANVVVNVDTHLNPERMRQILGRVRRSGSRHSHVFTFNLFCLDTQEGKYLDVLKRRAAVIDHVWDEEGQMYEKLSPHQLLELIRP
jgi:superfamily II DNA/RNA helicase